MNPISGGILVNDVHSGLNPTHVARVEQPGSLEEIKRLVREAARLGAPLALCGARHSMGGQQFGEGALLVDLSQHGQIQELDLDRGLVKADAGIRWPELIAGLHARQQGNAAVWSIRQKQTGADRMSLGGALSSNIHGRGLCMAPIISDVESFTLVDDCGDTRVCSRSENAELFALAIGGYGAFGVIAEVTLRLVLRKRVERRVEIIGADELMAAFSQRIAAGYEYGDFQFSTDENSTNFLRRGVFSCYRPIEDDRPAPEQQTSLETAAWERLGYLAHTDRRKAYEEYTNYYLTTDKQVYWSDTHQLSIYVDGYHAALDRTAGVPGGEMISELYVPRTALQSFLSAAARTLRDRAAVVIYGTVRLIERDEESFLAWAKESFACIIFNIHIDHVPRAIDEAAITFRALIDLAISFGGSFYLTYHRWATRAQVDACYPRFAQFLALQRRYDPAGRWQSDWLRHYQEMYSIPPSEL